MREKIAAEDKGERWLIGKSFEQLLDAFHHFLVIEPHVGQKDEGIVGFLFDLFQTNLRLGTLIVRIARDVNFAEVRSERMN